MSANIERAKARAQIDGLIARYGREIRLCEILDKLPKPEGFICPACRGTGLVTIVKPAEWPNEYAAPTRSDVVCVTCRGEGYTPREIKPRMVQEGWQ